MLGHHVAQYRLGDVHGSKDVHFEQVAQAFQWDVRDWSGLANARVVDENVDLPGVHFLHVRARDINFLNAQLRRFGAELLGLRVGLGRRDDVVAAFGQGDGTEATEARTGAGDHDVFTHCLKLRELVGFASQEFLEFRGQFVAAR